MVVGQGDGVALSGGVEGKGAEGAGALICRSF